MFAADPMRDSPAINAAQITTGNQFRTAHAIFFKLMTSRWAQTRETGSIAQVLFDALSLASAGFPKLKLASPQRYHGFAAEALISNLFRKKSACLFSGRLPAALTLSPLPYRRTRSPSKPEPAEESRPLRVIEARKPLPS